MNIEELIGKIVTVFGNNEEAEQEIISVTEDKKGYDIILDDETTFFLKSKDVSDFISGEKEVLYDGLTFKLVYENVETEEEEIEEEEPIVDEEEPEEEIIDIEQTPFNNAELFEEQYKDSLIGKKLNYNEEVLQIMDIGVDNDNVVTITINGNEHEGDIIGIISDNFEKFISGEKVQDMTDNPIQLILVEETPVVEEVVIEEPVESINKPEFKYYLIDSNNLICAGFEYQEDAKAQKKKYLEKGKIYEVRSLRDLSKMDIDVNQNSNWKIELVDTDLIYKALQDSFSSINENNRAYWTKEKIEESVSSSRFSSVEKLVDDLSKEYLKLFTTYSSDKTDKFYLKAKKYLLPLIEQIEILGDLNNGK